MNKLIPLNCFTLIQKKDVENLNMFHDRGLGDAIFRPSLLITQTKKSLKTRVNVLNASHINYDDHFFTKSILYRFRYIMVSDNAIQGNPENGAHKPNTKMNF